MPRQAHITVDHSIVKTEPLDGDSLQLSHEVIENAVGTRRPTNRKRCQHKKSRAPRNSLKYVELYFEKQLSEKDELITRMKQQLRMYNEAIIDMQEHLKTVVQAIHGIQCQLDRDDDIKEIHM